MFLVLLFVFILSLICTINFSFIALEFNTIYFLVSLGIFLISTYLIYIFYINPYSDGENCKDCCGDVSYNSILNSFDCVPDCDCSPDCSC